MSRAGDVLRQPGGDSRLITMGCGVECPVVPGLRRDDWTVPDPKGKPIRPCPPDSRIDQGTRLEASRQGRMVEAGAYAPIGVRVTGRLSMISGLP